MRLILCACLSSIVLSSGPLASAQEAILRGTVVDSASGLPAPCTVTIRDATSKIVVESDSLKSGFRSSGQFTKRLPPGRTHIRVTRGFETLAVEQEINLVAGRETEVTLRLERAVDLRKRGWYGSDHHVHMLHGERIVPVDFDYVALAARAEDLQCLSLAQDWTLEYPTPEALEKELGSRSTRDCLLTWNLEAPKNYYKGDAGRCLGHCWNVGVKGRTPEGRDVIHELMAASAMDYESSKPTYANFESHRLIARQGGAVFYSHPARWWTGPWGGQGGYPKQEKMRVSNMAVELPLDTLAGPTFDGLDIITGPGEFEANAKAFRLWSLLLNKGYQLAATASSDSCFDRPGGGVPGIVRTYTYLPGGFSLAKLTKAMAAGRTFVTSGPLLVATMDGAPPGSVFRAGRKERRLAVEAWKAGGDPRGLQRLEILRNGELFSAIQFTNYPACARTNLVVQERDNAWYSARVVGGDTQRQVAISGAFYFAKAGYRRPQPVMAQVRARILDAESGQPLRGTLTEVAYSGTVGHDGKRHALKNGEGQVKVPATVRLRAQCPGYDSQTLSPFLDSSELVETITKLGDIDLLDWTTFERIEKQLGHIELVFRLKPARASE